MWAIPKPNISHSLGGTMKPQRWSIQLSPGKYEGPFTDSEEAIQRAKTIRREQMDNIGAGRPSPFLLAYVVPFYDLNDPDERAHYSTESFSTEAHLAHEATVDPMYDVSA